MGTSPAFKGLFVFLLVLSVSGKVIIADRSQEDGTWSATDSAGKGEISAFFTRHGFQVGKDANDGGYPFMLPAVAGDCRLLAVYVAPQGLQRDVVRRLVAPHDTAFFIFRGVVYDDQPVWATRMYHYWRRINNYLGQMIPAKPVIGIVASPACDLRDMPWAELAELP